MKLFGTQLRLSATDLSNHLACAHLTSLDRRLATRDLATPSRWDPMLSVLRERGLAHEAAFLDHLRSLGLRVVELEAAGSAAEAATEVLHHMERGVDVIAQATLVEGDWLGIADVLLKVPKLSVLGDWSYEVMDTKLARETRGGTVLQLCLYTDLIASLQGSTPEFMHVVSPVAGFQPESFRSDDFFAYYRLIRQRLEQTVAKNVDAIETYPTPTTHCDVCKWWERCSQQRRADDHLSLVAGMGRLHERELESWGVNRVRKLGQLETPIQQKPQRGSVVTFTRLREQARVQLATRDSGAIVYEPLPIEPDRGLARLPEPSAGDIFLDFEGDPFAGDGGLEYLTGYVTIEDGRPTYRALWALDQSAEKSAFETFVDDVLRRWVLDPTLHIYHYAPYEPSAIKRLMGRHASREDEVDRMFRARLFVDLYAVVRQGLRVGVESYSIKSLEPLYGFEREVQLETASKNLRALEGALELGTPDDVTPEIRAEVEGYNKDDCMSTYLLRDWLEQARRAILDSGSQVPRRRLLDSAGAPESSEHRLRVLTLIERLLAGISDDSENRSPEDQAQWLLAQLLEWHRREEKVAWWEFYHLAEASDDDRFEEVSALAGLEFIESVGGTEKCPIHRYKFPVQDQKLNSSDNVFSDAETRIGTVVEVDETLQTIDIKKTQTSRELHPTSVFGHRLVRTDTQADALFRLGTWVAEHGINSSGEHRAARDLLLKIPPRGAATRGQPLLAAGEPSVPGAQRIALRLSTGVLPIQGPPGTGKTFTAARMIVALVAEGKRVGITAMSHKVITNLLVAVVKAAAEMEVELRCIQKIDQLSGSPDPSIEETKSNQVVLDRLANGTPVCAGTSWLWSRPDLAGTVDVLFIDEAGQMSLANVCAVAQAASSLVLVGDPRQLEQPIQGSHPPGTELSALEHVLDGRQTVTEDRGLFLADTWRLHPDICRFTSEQFYDGRLQSKPNLINQALRQSDGTDLSGLFFLPVEHVGNKGASIEEAEAIAEVVADLLRDGTAWRDEHLTERPLSRDDIIVVAPYNAQVGAIGARLPGIRVGTVDKFQGQEAPLVIYSMATSDPDDAPRGMEFLYSRNRLNVATSRARAACILVAHPALLEPDCRTPRQMQLANSHSRFLECALTWGELDEAARTPEESTEMSFEWPSHYPASCPPGDAQPASGRVFRLVQSNPPTADDFRSYRELQPEKDFGDKACMASGLSVLRAKSDAVRLRNRIPGLRDRAIAVGQLSEAHGVLRNTPTKLAGRDHFTWWLPVAVSPAPLFRVTKDSEAGKD